jgi:hypothetical protein
MTNMGNLCQLLMAYQTSEVLETSEVCISSAKRTFYLVIPRKRMVYSSLERSVGFILNFRYLGL